MNTRILDRAKELASDEKMTTAKIKAVLTLEDYKGKDIDLAIKALGVTRAKIEFRAVFHDWIIKTNPTEAAAKDYIMGKGEFGETSDNVQKHLNVYMGEWKLATRARMAALKAMEE